MLSNGAGLKRSAADGLFTRPSRFPDSMTGLGCLIEPLTPCPLFPMKFSFQWLKEYVDFPCTPPELADALTHLGLEVEGVTEQGTEFQGVVVGQLLSFRPLPDSDHLAVCQVTDGKKGFTVVCGAPNLKAGERVALALPGVILPRGVKIGSASFQGIVSEGMLCSEKELELSEEGAGILLLDPSLPLGMPLEKALELKDWILEVNVTPNRADCLCVIGLAREISALTGLPLRYPQKSSFFGPPKAADLTSVVIERPDLCPRYVVQLILGVEIKPSPFRIRRRLEALGVRAINNIVDATNYVMLEMGQPLHAFDFELLEEKRIVVRTAAAGDRFTTLDGVARTLPAETLMICDGKKPVALAGIMGGLNSEVEPQTKNILLESAYFDPMGIRRTSKKVGLSTEASTRFERGIDPNCALRAANRAAALMVEAGGGSATREAVDVYPRKIEPGKISLRPSRVNQILGTSISPEEIFASLKSLELAVEVQGGGSCQVIPPTFRVDLQREIDLVEEVARRHGFHKIPVTLPEGRVSAAGKTRIQQAIARAKEVLTAGGFWEVITYSFISPEMLRKLRLRDTDRRLQALRIHNPLSEEQGVMRSTLLPGLLQTVSLNANRQNFDLKIFELGRVFYPREGRELPEEIEVLSALLCGRREEESWAQANAEVDFFDLKGAVETLLTRLGVEGFQFLLEEKEPFLHPGAGCRIEAAGEPLGWMGEIHPEVREACELKQKIFVFELNFAAVAGRMRDQRTFKLLARFPAVHRDLALIVAETVSAGELLAVIRETNSGLITDVKIFDLYRGNPIPSGKKSLAFRFKYQQEGRTLTDAEVNELHQRIAQVLVEKHGAVLR
ncbi:MAG: phenylalanine--tRNA ligase subunit beta [Deltaproteobacteria bacterium]|nr:phenylalanine--tRNA ligase subunit beta [Deltaproteobacteria bacterium]